MVCLHVAPPGRALPARRRVEQPVREGIVEGAGAGLALPVLGHENDLADTIRRHRVEHVRAQVNGLRGDTSIGDRATFDNYYIENWSLWLDFKIMLRTVASVVRAQGG